MVISRRRWKKQLMALGRIATTLAGSVAARYVILWVVPASVAAYALLRYDRIGADQLAALRYTEDIVGFFEAGVPIAWFIQEGARLFPDLPISLLAYGLALGHTTVWGVTHAVGVLALLYWACVHLISAWEKALPKRHAVATAFILANLVLALACPLFARYLLSPIHHTALLPMSLLLYASLLWRGSHWSGRSWIPWVLAVVFGLTIQSDPLFVVWSCLPCWLCSGIISARRGRWRGFAFATLVLGSALLVNAGVGALINTLPFVVLSSGNYLALLPQNGAETGDRIASLLEAVAGVPGAPVLIVVFLLALALSLAAVWQELRTKRRTDSSHAFVIGLLFLCSAVVLPVAMVAANRLAPRYAFYIFHLALFVLLVVDSPIRLIPRGAFRRVLFPVLLALAVTPAWFYKAGQTPPRFANVAAALRDMREAELIGEEGIANYWLSYPLSEATGFQLAPVTGARVEPNLRTANAYDFWRWEDRCPKPRLWSFVITSREERHRLDPRKLRQQFGVPDQVMNVTGPGLFQVWLYPNGVGRQEQLYRLVRQQARFAGMVIDERRDCPQPAP